MERFFAEAPDLNPKRKMIKGVICGVRVEEIKEPLMQEIRYLDKLIDELAREKQLKKFCEDSFKWSYSIIIAFHWSITYNETTLAGANRLLRSVGHSCPTDFYLTSV